MFQHQMSDLHCGESIENDDNTTRVMRTLIHAEDPDFLVYSGDMVSCTCECWLL